MSKQLEVELMAFQIIGTISETTHLDSRTISDIVNEKCQDKWVRERVKEKVLLNYGIKYGELNVKQNSL